MKATIYHRPKSEDAYAYDKSTMHIRLRTGKNYVQKVNLIYGDPYDWVKNQWVTSKKEMTPTGSDAQHDFWFVEVTPPYRRLRYGFEIITKTETIYYGESGFLDTPSKDTSDYFCFPFMNSADLFSPPEWVKDTVWYQIFPERFANGDPSRNPEGTLPWGSAAPTPTNHFGGDLQGIIDHLDYLQELGINGIYLTPIFEAFSNHKYDTIDYVKVDPHFGDKATFKRLVDECHKRGIRIMLDAVFNHAGFYFPPFQDVLKNQQHSKYRDWFHLRDFPVRAEEPPNYDTFAFTPFMPKFNTENEKVREYLLNVATYWIKEFDIDGWRLDVANEVDHAFWREFRKRVKALKPDLYILGEVWHNSLPWLAGDQFDAVMNYPLTNAIIDFAGKQKIGKQQFEHVITQLMHMYPIHVQQVAFNLLGSHDTPRILTQTNHDVARVKLQFLLLFSQRGTPCIYYGDEIGMTGEQDPGCRKCMIWEEEEQNQELLSFVKRLIQLRKQEKAFGTEGDLTFVENDSSLLIYQKTYENQQLLFVINSTDQPDSVQLPVSWTNRDANDLLTGETLSLTTEIGIPAKSAMVLK
ncbi:alpha-glycosidase [Halalkalibacterium halodurans]|uniref:alpha-glycosidase n=1 Tax=Halalkalibacterium halodurans TaxID=86665 RepID=UPI002E1F6831|nr:alpha-glycosidase [Halalkalibacterium halodurans]